VTVEDRNVKVHTGSLSCAYAFSRCECESPAKKVMSPQSGQIDGNLCALCVSTVRFCSRVISCLLYNTEYE
jgi:hypothetical protein